MPERPYLRLLPEPVARPDLRHPQRRDVAVYRVRVHIDDSKPTIWRRLDVRSDVTLDVLHQILQVAFDWTDSHLHRFSLGGGAFDRQSQLFLCPYDVDNDDWPDDDDEGRQHRRTVRGRRSKTDGGIASRTASGRGKSRLEMGSLASFGGLFAVQEK